MQKLRLLAPIVVIVCLLVGSNLPAVPAHAAENQARFIKDINPARDTTGSSAPARFVRAGAYTYFRANDSFSGRTLWRTDGTTAGTVAVINDYLVGPGDDFRDNTLLAALDNTPYLITNKGVLKIDGVNDVETIKAFEPGSGPSEEDQIIRSGNLLYFTLGNQQMWRTDGTPAGTFAIKTIGYRTSFADYQGTLYFSNQQKLWKTDGTSSGTVVVADVDARGLMQIGNLLYFLVDAGSSQYYLWRSDGTTAGTYELFSAATRYLTDVDGVAYFLSDTTLWKTNGTKASTKQVVNNRDLHVANALVSFKGNLYFSTRTALWRSDGTSSGTVRVTTTTTLPEWADLYRLFAASDRLYLVINGDSGSGFAKELWTSDGTTTGTRKVATLGDFIDDFFEMDDSVLFAYNSPENGKELWRSNGTPSGTFLLKDIYVDPADSNPTGIQAIGNQVVFTATTVEAGTEMWRSDGTTAGTTLLKDIVPGSGSSFPNILANIGSAVLFVVFEDNVLNLWRTDGTSAGTTSVFRFPESVQDLFASDSTVYNGKFYTLSRNIDNEVELWTSDGTIAGTYVVKDFGQNASAADPSPDFTLSNGDLYFRHEDGVNGAQLWRTNGTENGTTQITRFMSDDGNTTLTNLVDYAGKLCFSAEHLLFNALWCSDGTTGGTRVVRDILPEGRAYEVSTIVVANGTMYFGTYDEVNEANNALWRSDGTTAGTSIVKQGVAFFYLYTIGGKLVFPDLNGQLWVSDGTEAGTTSLQTASAPLRVRSETITALPLLGIIVFAGSDDFNDTELWQTDGTVAGTVRTADVVPGSGASDPLAMAAKGNTIFFSANDPTHGRELWSVDIDAPTSNTRVYLPLIAR